MEVTEGMRVYFDEGGPVYLCVGRDEDNFYFQDENTTSVVILQKSVQEINSLIALGNDIQSGAPETGSTQSVEPPVATTASQSSTSTAATAAADADDMKKSWTSSKVLHLITLYEQHEQEFCNNVIKKKDTWQKVANKLNATGGMQFTADEVDKKWRGLRERYKKIVDSNKQTGRGKSTWEFMEPLRQILDKDPAVNPPCVVSAGCVAAVDIRQQDVSVPQASGAGTTTSRASDAGTPTTTSKRGHRKRKSELSTSLDRFIEEANSRHKNIVSELNALVQQEKRKNDLFERFLDTISKK